MPTRTSEPLVASGPTVGFVLLVGSLAMLPAVSTDMYLPSLPDVGRDLLSSTAGVQLTITGMVLGGAFGQLVIGPLSDRFGRRRPVLVGVSLHAVLSVLCAMAPTIAVLVVLRVLQGFVAAAATVVAIAMIRDRYTGADAASLMSRLMLVIGVAPLFAPSVGSVVAAHWGWRGVFVVLAVLGAVLVTVVAVALPETLPRERRVHSGAATLARGYLTLLADRRFVALAVLPGLGLVVIISYVSGSPFVLQEEFGLSAVQFSLVFALGGIGLVLGAQLNAALVRRVGPARLLRASAPTAAAAAGVLLLLAVTERGGLVGLVSTLWLVLLLLGFLSANASALAMTRHGERAGTAAATIGFLQAGLAGGISPLVGVLGGDAVAMSAVILGALVVAVLVLACATPAYRRQGWVELGKG
ncbi:multidrug effflux MFS transporter [Actinotalea sp.]|uniref:multidrug effflux MFS transporter n=1 Tax=Actinotalea sp. TaxID=1872145 RepID=UPI003567927B